MSSTLEGLPTEVKQHIFAYLPNPRALGCLPICSRSLHAFFQEDRYVATKILRNRIHDVVLPEATLAYETAAIKELDPRTSGARDNRDEKPKLWKLPDVRRMWRFHEMVESLARAFTLHERNEDGPNSLHVPGPITEAAYNSEVRYAERSLYRQEQFRNLFHRDDKMRQLWNEGTLASMFLSKFPVQESKEVALARIYHELSKEYGGVFSPPLEIHARLVLPCGTNWSNQIRIYLERYADRNESATMLLKRKRSESELSFSSSSSAFSSPPRNEAAFTFSNTDTSPLRFLSSARSRGSSTTPAHLPSRTMKRFRDNRPSDDEIHQRTLNMLYTAQRQQIQHDTHAEGTSAFATQPVSVQPAAATPPSQAQASLHSFWKLPGTSASAQSALDIDRTVYAPSSCEDCGLSLSGTDRNNAGDDSMDVDTDVDCGACGKHVCSHCSITNLGERRRCLNCAGRKVWVG
ncbi:Uu.00g030440.m01.CDS01 [Anthostomella pinea]|uniref:Uu.00g030440.m01.CDS01 n=1 Tax=Anthostomella pinea TaxID=933095 RepID=A0AAI8YCW6_9PEZI|nr:Uu.00g030440.m01.CDS01 [Anthostomella pinea]